MLLETTVKEAVKKHMSIMDDYPLIQRQVAMSYQESKTLFKQEDKRN